MPSLYEPCGLNQSYSMRYGTLPIVRATGGLDDTVHNYDERTGAGTGFKFWDPSASALYYCIGWAISTWYARPADIKALQQHAMSQEFLWSDAAKQYVLVYEHAIKKPALPCSVSLSISGISHSCRRALYVPAPSGRASAVAAQAPPLLRAGEIGLPGQESLRPFA